MRMNLENRNWNRPLRAVGRISRPGFTLMEILVVMAIIVVLAGLGSVAFMNELERSKEKSAAINSTTIKTAVMSYKTNTGDWPGSLQELVPSYLEKAETLIDPWGQQFQFQVTEDENNRTCYVWTTTKAGKPLGNAPK